jgi:hypothetical protein
MEQLEGEAGASTEIQEPTSEPPDVSFYADDGRIGGSNAVAVQASLETFTDLFARMGLAMNATKTVAMSSVFLTRTGKMHTEAY